MCGHVCHQHHSFISASWQLIPVCICVFSCASPYSFGIVLWEVCTRCVPFQEYPFTCDVRNAVLSGVRPTIPVTCSAAYRTLMQECWHGDHMQRPTFAEIVPKLDEQLEMCLSSGVERNPSASPSRPASTLTIQ